MISIILVFLTFAFIHSITAARWFKESCRRTFGDRFMNIWYRFLYSVVSVITVVVAIYLISLIPDKVIGKGPLWFNLAMHGIQLGGLFFGIRAFEYLDTAEFLGFKQVWRYFRTGEAAGNIEGLTQKELVSNGVYGIVRHPLYLSGIIIFTFNPYLTVNGHTVTVLADLYFMFGSFIEERRLLKTFGDQYLEYRERVPRLVPRLRFYN